MIRVSLWTAAFLILLRVCIGWHFFFEGVTKVKSAYQGTAAANEKPFSSAAYFRESEGPFGKLIQKQLGDPDQAVIDRLTPKPAGDEPSPLKSRFPAALEAEWDEYFNRFVAQFKLDDTPKAEALTRLGSAKTAYVNWLNGTGDIDPETKKPKEVRLTVKHKAPPGSPSGDFDEEVTVPERIAELKEKSAAVREAYDKKLFLFGKDVEGANLRTMKADATAIRTDLQKEIDAHTTKMKEGLTAVLGTRVTAYEVPAPKEVPDALDKMLVPMAGGNNPLGKTWDEYAAFVKDVAPGITDDQKAKVDDGLKVAKERFDRWLADQDPYTAAPAEDRPVAAWREALATAQSRASAAADRAKALPEKPTSALARALRAYALADQKDTAGDVDTIRGKMLADLRAQSDAMRSLVGTPLLGADRSKGLAAPVEEYTLWVIPKNWTVIDYMDWSTRWFLTVVGAFLMVGLFTRLSCFSAAGFLLLTYLTQPSFPWLPVPPNQEGTYLFVNKNVIEMVALLALMGARTGQWVGLDGLIGWAFGRKRGER